MDRNKRKLKRIKLVCALPVFDRDHGEQLGMLENITTEGLGLRGPNFIKTGSTFRVTLQLPSEIEHRAEVDIDVCCVWSAESGTPGLYDAGFCFLNPSCETSDIIEELIRDFQR